MGIIKISDLMHNELRYASEAYCRSINAQAEYWLRIGMLAETHPHSSYTDITRMLLKDNLPVTSGRVNQQDMDNLSPTQQKEIK